MPSNKPWSVVRANLYALIARNPKSNRLVVDIADISPGDVTLDVGCGPGAAVRVAAQIVRRAVGVDNSPAMVRVARRRSQGLPGTEFHVAPAEALPFPDDEFTRVWTIHAFHHWSDESAGVAEALRVLQPGGRLLILERRANHSHGLTRPAADELATRLETIGFRDAHVEQHGKDLVIVAVA